MELTPIEKLYVNYLPAIKRRNIGKLPSDDALPFWEAVVKYSTIDYNYAFTVPLLGTEPLSQQAAGIARALGLSPEAVEVKAIEGCLLQTDIEALGDSDIPHFEKLSEQAVPVWFVDGYIVYLENDKFVKTGIPARHRTYTADIFNKYTHPLWHVTLTPKSGTTVNGLRANGMGMIPILIDRPLAMHLKMGKITFPNLDVDLYCDLTCVEGLTEVQRRKIIEERIPCGLVNGEFSCWSIDPLAKVEVAAPNRLH